MAGALALHDAILRAAVEGNGGSVIKTTGDGVLAVFDEPVAALSAALDAQRALRDGDWGEIGPLRVRMAIHAGTAEIRDGDYFGPALNRSARILAIGHGGQILVSAMAVVLAGDRLPGRRRAARPRARIGSATSTGPSRSSRSRWRTCRATSRRSARSARGGRTSRSS